MMRVVHVEAQRGKDLSARRDVFKPGQPPCVTALSYITGLIKGRQTSVSVAYLQTQKLGQMQLPSVAFLNFSLMCCETSSKEICHTAERVMRMKYSTMHHSV